MAGNRVASRSSQGENSYNNTADGCWQGGQGCLHGGDSQTCPWEEQTGAYGGDRVSSFARAIITSVFFFSASEPTGNHQRSRLAHRLRVRKRTGRVHRMDASSWTDS